MNDDGQKRYVDGLKIAKLRCDKGMSQDKLGNKSGVSKSQIQRIEGGKAIDLKMSTVTKLAEALDVALVDIIFGKGDD